MAFADILVGLAKRGREHKISLLDMEHEDNVQQAKIFAQLAESESYEPEQRQKFLEQSIGMLTDPAKFKKTGIKNGMVQIPVRDMLRPSKPLASAEAAELKPGENIELPLAMKPPTFLPQAPAAAKAIESAGPELLRKGQIPIPEGIGEISAPSTMPGGLASKQPRNIRTLPGSASSDILLPPAAPPPAWTPIGQPISPQTQAFRKNQAAADLEEIREASRRANDERDAAKAAALQKQKDEAALVKQRELIASREKIAGMTNDARAKLVKTKGLQPEQLSDDLIRDGKRYARMQAFDPETQAYIRWEEELGEPKKGPESQSPMAVAMRAVMAANPGINEAQARAMMAEDEARGRALGTASVTGVPTGVGMVNGVPTNIARPSLPGTAAPRTVYDAAGVASTGGAPVSLTPPPTVDAGTQQSLAGWTQSIDMLDRDIIPSIRKQAESFGPLAGRVTMAEIEKLGGMGASQADMALALDLRRLLMSQAFAEGGKQLTGTEKEEFEATTPRLTDTFAQAIIKAEAALKFLKGKRDARLGVMPARQRQQIPVAPKPAGPPLDLSKYETGRK